MICRLADRCAARTAARCELGAPPSHQDRGVRNPSVLALIGACDTMLHQPHKGTTYRSKGPYWSSPAAIQRTKPGCVPGGRSSAYLPQPFPSSSMFDRGVSLGANHAMEKKEVLDGTICVRWRFPMIGRADIKGSRSNAAMIAVIDTQHILLAHTHQPPTPHTTQQPKKHNNTQPHVTKRNTTQTDTNTEK